MNVEEINCNRKSVWIAADHMGTINPFNCEESATNTIKIEANEAGPINPKKYKNAALKILYLLKEPYISIDSYKSGDRGGHNQSEERDIDPISDGNRTYRRVIDSAAMIGSLYNILPEYSSLSEKEKIELFRTSVCVLNVNNFPCIGTKSDDRLIKKWARLNERPIIEQIRKNSPDIIVGGHTLGYFFEEETYQIPKNMRDWILEKQPANRNMYYGDNGKAMLSLLGYHIPLICQMQSLINAYGTQDNDFYCYFNKDVIFINANHPGHYFDKKWSEKVAERVNYANERQKKLWSE